MFFLTNHVKTKYNWFTNEIVIPLAQSKRALE